MRTVKKLDLDLTSNNLPSLTNLEYIFSMTSI